MRIARGISIANTSKPIGITYDADAVAFFTAASITDTTQKNAVNTLVLSLKSANIWTKMKALYPVVGGIASSHAVNLKTPGTYNLTFATGWTHSNTGMTPNGATYANTNFNPQSIITDTNNFSLTYYSRTNIDSGCDIGVFNSSTNSASQIFPKSSGIRYVRVFSSFTTESTSESTSAFYINSRLNSTTVKAYRNGTTLTTLSLSNLGNINYNVYIGARNNVNTADAFSTRQCAFASIGDGLTDVEASSFYTAVQTFQTTLGRQV